MKAKQVYSLSNILLTKSGTIGHALWQHPPLKTGHRSNKINNGEAKGKVFTVLWVEGNRKKAILKVYNYFIKSLRNSNWGGQAWL